MKYIIIDQGYAEVAVLFDVSINHSDMHVDAAIVSAGFVDIVDGKAHCFGMSESLDMDSRPELDSKLVNYLITRR